MEIPERVQRKLRELPDAPGCYLMRDRRGRIVYVGKAASLRKRVQSYFRKATLRSAPPKLRGLIKSIADFDVIVVRNEAEAVLTEGQLIKDYKPRYNVSFRDDKRFLMLRADPAEPLPRFGLCRIKRDDGARYFGPYVSAASARLALDFVEKRYGLRKCAPRIPDEETYRHCINDIVRFCAAPCIGKVSPDEYRERFDEACAFLRGERPAVLKEIEERMQAAAGNRHFEDAAALRDTLLLLRRAVRERARIAPSPELQAREAAEGAAELGRVLGLDRVPRVIEAYDISNISGTYAVASMVCAVDGIPHRNRYRRFRIRTVTGSDDPRMMAEVMNRRFRRLKNEGTALPDLVVVDGGITQLRAARRALDDLALAGAVPCAGLAKRFEEIYWEDPGRPLRLPRDAGALKVLQRLRDEAHRFALTYHRALRRRRIRESALDAVPGIGKQRKEALLRHFGSLRRLQQASVDEIAQVPGFGVGTARTIQMHLAREERRADD